MATVCATLRWRWRTRSGVREAVRRGAQPRKTARHKDEHGTIRRLRPTYGDTIHSLISYKDYKGPFCADTRRALRATTAGFCASITS